MDVTQFKKIAESKEYNTPKYTDYDDLDRTFWRSVTMDSTNAPIYGADTTGTLFDDGVPWNLNHLDTILGDLEEAGIQVQGVTDPYLYFGMWKTTFAWHIEDMNLYSINYVHFGESKRWYGVPTDAAHRMEAYAKSHFDDGFKVKNTP